MSKLTPSINKADHVKGEDNAQVTLVEYGDFECPNCGQAYPIVKELQKIEGNKIKFIFRNFPLSEIHPHTLQAAYAVEAAAKQGKFWEMYDLLFENQEALEDEDLFSYAKTLNLNTKQFLQDMVSKEVTKKVRSDFMGGVKSGVNGTPTFFINDIRFDEPYELDFLLKAIEMTAKHTKGGNY